MEIKSTIRRLDITRGDKNIFFEFEGEYFYEKTYTHMVFSSGSTSGERVMVSKGVYGIDEAQLLMNKLYLHADIHNLTMTQATLEPSPCIRIEFNQMMNHPNYCKGEN